MYSGKYRGLLVDMVLKRLKEVRLKGRIDFGRQGIQL
jgi:hypothetical protein